MSYGRFTRTAGAFFIVFFSMSSGFAQSRSDEIKTMGDWREATKSVRMKYVSELASEARKTNYYVSEPKIYECLTDNAYFWSTHIPFAEAIPRCIRDE